MHKRKRRKSKLAKRLKIHSNSKPAKASNYLYRLKRYHLKYPDMVVILYLRVSARSQDHNGNLLNQEMVLRRKLKKLGILVVDCFREVCSGWVTDHHRGVLRLAVRKALQFKNAVILAVSADRFLRNKDFHTKNNRDVLPTIAEFEKLNKLTNGVPLVTYLHPNMPWKKVRGFQSKWGQRAKGNKGGRPRKRIPGYKKQRRVQRRDEVLWLHEQGKNLSEIAAKTGIARSTIKGWIQKEDEKLNV